MSVKGTRCPSISLIFLGVLFLFVGVIYFGIQVAQYEQSKHVVASSFSALKTYWIFGYPLFIALWTVVTGGVGVCASRKRRPALRPTKNICKICTFMQFSLTLAGFLGYFSFDFAMYFKTSYTNINSNECVTLNKKITTNCYVRTSLEGCALAIDGLILIFTIWCILCCCRSLCCDTATVHSSEQVTGDQQVQPREGQEENPNASTPPPTTTQIHTPSTIDRPVIPPIGGTHSTVTPTAPIYNPDDDQCHYNPAWPPADNQTDRDRGSPPPYSLYPETAAVRIDRQTSRVYFAHSSHRGYLNPLQ